MQPGLDSEEGMCGHMIATIIPDILWSRSMETSDKNNSTAEVVMGVIGTRGS